MNNMLRYLFPLILLTTAPAGAQTLLDPAFGVRGLATLPAPVRPDSFDQASNLASDALGRVYFARNGWHPSGVHSYVERRLPDGTRDPAFGRDGVQLVRGGDGRPGQVVDIEPVGAAGGTLVLVGTASNECILQHWFADGRIDPSYGSGGSRLVGYFKCGDVAVVGEDALIVGRDERVDANAYVRRYDRTGTLAGTFATNGELRLDAAGANAIPARIAVDGSNAYALLTGAPTGGMSRPVVARFALDTGTLDTGWGTQGLWVPADPGVVDQAVDLVVDGTDLLVSSSFGKRLWRVGSTGATDAAYGGITGCAVPAVPGYDLQFAGQLVLDGQAHLIPTRFVDAPFTPDSLVRIGFLALSRSTCSLASGYGTDGHVFFAAPGLSNLNLSVVRARSAGDRVLVAADAYERPGGTSDPDAVLLATTRAGALQPFGANAFLRVDGDADPWTKGPFHAFAVDGGYVIGGIARREVANRASVVAARIRNDGLLDQTYGNGGYVMLDGTGEARVDGVMPGAIDAGSGGLVLAMPGRTDNQCDVAVRRFDTAGVASASFGTAGTVRIAPSGSCALPLAMKLLADGRVLLLVELIGPAPAFQLLRLAANGSPDASFGSGGAIAVANVTPDDLVVTPAGYFVAGRTWSSTPEGVVVHAFAANGMPLAGFGVDGRSVRRLNALGHVAATATSDGALLVTTQGEFQYTQCNVLRVDAAGTWDATYGVGGLSALPCVDGAALAADGNGAFMMTTRSMAAPVPLAISRLLANGTPDPAFATNGTLFAGDPATSKRPGYAVVSDARGTLVVASDGLDWSLARIRPANDDRISLDGFE